MNQSATTAVAPEVWISATDRLVSNQMLGSLTVCDTSFGDGLRFLTLWSFWRQRRMPGAKLQVIAFSTARSWPSIRNRRAQGVPGLLQVLDVALEKQWPDALPGVHRLSFDSGAVTLTLIFQPLSVALRQMDAIVDVFWISDANAFLSDAGGASPAGKLVRVAGARAQVLGFADDAQRLGSALQQAGFQIQQSKAAGHAGTSARLRAGLCHTTRSTRVGADVLVVGAGVAGAAIAWGLAQRGHYVKVFDPMLRSNKAGVHAGHFAAAVSPYLSKDDDYRARLSRAGVARAWANWSVLKDDARPIQCGALGLPTPERDAQAWQDMLMGLRFPEGWADWLGPEAASHKANEFIASGGCYRACGMLVRPDRLLPALLSHSRISCIGEAVNKVSRCQEGGGWLQTESAVTHEAPVMVLANARNIGPFLHQLTAPGELPRLERMQAVPGQVSYFNAADFNGGPNCVLDAAAYWLPQVEGVLTAGGTYDLNQRIAQVTARGHQEITQKLLQILPAQRRRLLDSAPTVGGWAGWRAVVTGRLPVIGPLHGSHDIWVATAYGSRGLTWAALAADLIASKLNDEPAILERDLLAALLPR